MEVTYEGRDITPDVSLAAGWLELHASGCADKLTVRFNDTRNLWGTWRPSKGDELSVVDRSVKSGRMVVSAVRPQSSLMTLVALSAPMDAIEEARWKSWQEVHFMQLASEIAGRHDLALEVYGATDHIYEYVEQMGQSDLAFLDKRCALEGYGLLIYDGKLVIYSGESMDAQTPAGSITVTPGDDYRILDDDFERYGSCRVTDGNVTGSFVAGDGNELAVTLVDRISDIAEANRFARGLLRHKNRQVGHVRVTTDTFLDQYATGSVLEFEATAAGSFDGPAFVEFARFDFMRRNTLIELRPVIAGY